MATITSNSFSIYGKYDGIVSRMVWVSIALSILKVNLDFHIFLFDSVRCMNLQRWSIVKLAILMQCKSIWPISSSHVRWTVSIWRWLQMQLSATLTKSQCLIVTAKSPESTPFEFESKTSRKSQHLVRELWRQYLIDAAILLSMKFMVKSN